MEADNQHSLRTGPLAYAAEWRKPLDLDALNPKLHGGLRDDEALFARASGFISAALDLNGVASRLPSSPACLDIGSGVGWPMQALFARLPDARVTGLDLSENLIAKGKERMATVAPHSQYEFKHYDGAEFPFADDTFDFTYAIAMLWHLPDMVLWRLMKEAIRVTKPRGWCAFHFNHFDRFAYEIDAQIAIQFEGRPGHHHFFRPPGTIARALRHPIMKGKRIDIHSDDRRFYWAFCTKGEGPDFGNEELARLISGMDSYVFSAQ